MKGITELVRRRGFLLAATVFASFGFASVASAATYTVNDTRDLTQSAAAASAGTCVSTQNTCTIRAAVEAANENGGATTINVPAGTYPINSSTSSATPTCGVADDTTGDFKVNPCNNSTAITLTGAGSGVTVINAQTMDRIFEVWTNGVLNISGATLENGVNSAANGNDRQHSDGGAIESEGHLTVSNVTFTGNTATDGGGAIFAENTSGSTLTVTGSVFQNNSATDNEGGGAIADESPNDVSISFTLFQANTDSTTTGNGGGGAIVGCNVAINAACSSGAASALTLNFDDFIQNTSSDLGGGGLAWAGTGAVNITNSLFSQNQAISGDGGGIANGGTSVFNVSNTSFDGNTAGDDGGGLEDSNPGSDQLNLTQDKFTGNSATTNGGGAALTSPNSTETIISSEFDGNQVTGTGPANGGGGLYWEESPLTIYGTSFTLNSAPLGGGLMDSNDLLLTMEDSTFSRNTASSEGGGIYVEFVNGPVTLINNTIAFNNAPAGQGGGIDGLGNFSSGGSASTGFGVENNVIAENSGGDCEGKVTPSVDIGNNDDSDQSCFGGQGGPHDLVGVNPLLSNPANNGGPAAGGPGDTVTVQTDAEQSSSPTVNAGNNNGCPSVDERGVSRPQGSACDIGAFEFGANPTSTSTTTTGVTTTTSRTTTTTRTTTKGTGKRCPKGKHKSHGRCVKNHKPKHKRCPKGKVRKGKRCVKKPRK